MISLLDLLNQMRIYVTPILTVILELWWFWLFIVLFVAARSFFLTFSQTRYKQKVKWVMLELRIPREIRRSPRAMEQVFMTIHTLRNSPAPIFPAVIKEKYLEGQVTLWFSFEITSFGGELHFYIRTPEAHRNVIETSLYAQYPTLEMVVADDYIDRLPGNLDTLEEAGYALFGSELLLNKADAYPIRTYVDFETNVEEQQLDPISALLEALAKIKPQQHIWLQIIVRPADDKWKKEGEKLVEELKEKNTKSATKDDGKAITKALMRSPGETDVMKAIERNISKPGFETLIRYVYISPKDIFDFAFGVRGVFSSFNQYASETLNKFKANTNVWTLASPWYPPYLFPQRRAKARRERMYEAYRTRKIPTETVTGRLLEARFYHWAKGAYTKRMVLNAEELATIFHPPTNVVLTAPMIKRVESSKVGPPAGLPIYGEGGEKLPGV